MQLVNNALSNVILPWNCTLLMCRPVAIVSSHRSCLRRARRQLWHQGVSPYAQYMSRIGTMSFFPFQEIVKVECD